MIYYVAHWDWILLESRGNLISNIEDKKFASICPIDNFKELKKYLFTNKKSPTTRVFSIEPVGILYEPKRKALKMAATTKANTKASTHSRSTDFVARSGAPEALGVEF